MQANALKSGRQKNDRNEWSDLYCQPAYTGNTKIEDPRYCAGTNLAIIT